ncbi:WD40 repeat domain-containing protein [Roseateles sp. P5_E7]
MPPRSDPKLGKSYAIRFVPHSDLLVCLGQKVKLRQRLGREHLANALPFSHPSECSISPDASLLAVKNTSGAIALLDLPTLQVRWIRPPAKQGCQLLFSPCGQYLVTGSWNGELMRLETASGAAQVLDRTAGSMLKWVSQSEDRLRYVYVKQPIAVERDSPPGDSIVALRSWPFESHPEQRLAGPWRFVWAAEISPDARWLAVLHQREGGDFQVDIVDLSTAFVLSSTPVVYGGTNISLAWSPDGQHVACVRSHGVTVFEAPSLRIASEVSCAYACHVSFSPDGEFLAIGAWEQGTVKRVTDLLAPQSAASSV